MKPIMDIMRYRSLFARRRYTIYINCTKWLLQLSYLDASRNSYLEFMTNTSTYSVHLHSVFPYSKNTYLLVQNAIYK